MKKRVTFDFETRSMCDLKKAGAYKYSLDPTTQPTCMAFKVAGDETYLFDFDTINRPWDKQIDAFRLLWDRLIRFGYQFSAHNAFFERCIYTNILVKRYGWPEIPARLYRCTAAKAAACALPRNLEGAGAALKLTTQKDKRGYSAMMATCKPTKAWKAWEKKRIGPEPDVFLEPHHSPEVWSVLYEYCKIDVETEELLDDALPDLIPREQEIWFLNQEINWRGLRIDVPLVNKIVGIMADENRKKLKELDSLTTGLVTKPGARQSILDFLALEGVELANLQSKTVDDTLARDDLSGDMKRLLEIRKALSLTSTKKYQTMLDRVSHDGRVRDLVLYHGASTGRDTGVGVQPHNFPRGLMKVSKDRPYAHVENVVECDMEMLRLLYGESLAVLFSAILRNMIIPSPGHDLFVGDFSSIEVAVLWWLAGNKRGLEILRQGKDVYRYQAAMNLNRQYEDIPEEGDSRQLGKAQVLGCGFGMGWEKFKETGWAMYRLKLTDDQSKFAVASYRNTHPEVPLLWKAYESAAIAVVEGRHSDPARSLCYRVGKCTFQWRKDFLWIKLPSGRELAYREPQVAWREGKYGSQKTLEFWAVNSKTKKWALERTWGGTLTENIVQAVARDLMMDAIVRLEKAGYRALLTVHDEAMCEKKSGDLSVFTSILTEVPQWAEGLPVRAKAWRGPRYRK